MYFTSVIFIIFTLWMADSLMIICTVLRRIARTVRNCQWTLRLLYWQQVLARYEVQTPSLNLGIP